MPIPPFSPSSGLTTRSAADQRTEIHHAELGHVATSYVGLMSFGPRVVVSFDPLVWGPHGSEVQRLSHRKRMGEPGYGLGYAKTVPHGSDALAVVAERLAQLAEAIEAIEAIEAS